MHLVCLSLGCPHPDHLPLTWRQWCDWEAYYDLAPWGPERDDWRQVVRLAAAARMGGADNELPNLVWPYWGDSPSSLDLSPDDIAEAMRRHRERFGYVSE